MKKIIILFLCILFCNPVFAWVFAVESVEKDPKGILLPQLLSGNPLGVCIYVRKPYAADMDCKDSSCSDMYESTKAVFEKSYQAWFSQVRRVIVQSNRSAEFQDILNILPNRLSFTYVNGPENNYKPCIYQEIGYDMWTKIHLILSPFNKLMEIGGKIEGGLYVYHGGPNPPILKFYYNEGDFGLEGYPLVQGKKMFHNGFSISNMSTSRTMLHELGHSLGLGDLYAKAAGNSYNSRRHTTNAIQSPTSTSSIMNESLRVECDDVDGIINLMDHYFGSDKLKNSVRRQKGWVSLCPNRNIAYAYGMAFGITEEEKALYQEFAYQTYSVAGTRVDTVSPFSAKVRELYQQTSAWEEEQIKKQEQQEQKKRELEAALAKEDEKITAEADKIMFIEC